MHYEALIFTATQLLQRCVLKIVPYISNSNKRVALKIIYTGVSNRQYNDVSDDDRREPWSSAAFKYMAR